jgi:hypothetical protein
MASTEKRRKKQIAIFSALALIVLLLAYKIICQPEPERATLSLFSRSTSLQAIEFGIGDTAEVVFGLLDSNGIDYNVESSNEKLTRITCAGKDGDRNMKYNIVLFDEMLERIEADDAVDGIGMVIPRNYHN